MDQLLLVVFRLQILLPLIFDLLLHLINFFLKRQIFDVFLKEVLLDLVDSLLELRSLVVFLLIKVVDIGDFALALLFDLPFEVGHLVFQKRDGLIVFAVQTLKLALRLLDRGFKLLPQRLNFFVLSNLEISIVLLETV